MGVALALLAVMQLAVHTLNIDDLVVSCSADSVTVCTCVGK